MPRIIGIDPGSRNAGFGVIDQNGQSIRLVKCGVIQLNPRESLAHRLHQLSEELDQIYRTHDCKATVVEKIFLGKNADSAFKLGHARGVCLLKAQEHGSNIFEYAARAVKKCVTGAGGADKHQVQIAVRHHLRLREPMALDASDALALAVSHCSFAAMEQKLREVQT